MEENWYYFTLKETPEPDFGGEKLENELTKAQAICLFNSSIFVCISLTDARLL